VYWTGSTVDLPWPSRLGRSLYMPVFKWITHPFR
jgi:hypothetical protein